MQGARLWNYFLYVENYRAFVSCSYRVVFVFAFGSNDFSFGSALYLVLNAVRCLYFIPPWPCCRLSRVTCRVSHMALIPPQWSVNNKHGVGSRNVTYGMRIQLLYDRKLEWELILSGRKMM